MFEVFGMFWAHTCTVVAFDSFYLDSAFFEHRLRVCGKDVILFMVAELLAVREFRDTWQSFRKFSVLSSGAIELQLSLLLGEF